MDRCPTPLEVDRMIRRVRARARGGRVLLGLDIAAGGPLVEAVFGPPGTPPTFMPPLPPPAAGASVNRTDRARPADVVPVRIEQCGVFAGRAADPDIVAANRALLARAWLRQLP